MASAGGTLKFRRLSISKCGIIKWKHLKINKHRSGIGCGGFKMFVQALDWRYCASTISTIENVQKHSLNWHLRNFSKILSRHFTTLYVKATGRYWFNTLDFLILGFGIITEDFQSSGMTPLSIINGNTSEIIGKLFIAKFQNLIGNATWAGCFVYFDQSNNITNILFHLHSD